MTDTLNIVTSGRETTQQLRDTAHAYGKVSDGYEALATVMARNTLTQACRFEHEANLAEGV